MTARSGRALLIVAHVLTLTGCTVAARQPVTERFWPEPPLAPRIKFVGLLSSQRDLASAPLGWFTDALAGSEGSPALAQPMGVAASRDGKRLYVTDYVRRRVFVFDFAARRVSPLVASVAGFEAPLGIAVDGADNVYVVDSSPPRVHVFDRSGTKLRTITHPSLERPTGIAVDSVRDRLYVSDSSSRSSDSHKICAFDLSGNYLGSFGGRGRDHGKFFFATYLALDPAGNLYVTDTMNARVEVFDTAGHYVKTVGRSGDAPGMFDKPKGVAIDSFGNIYVVDSAWSNVQIFNQRGEALLSFGGRGRLDGFLFNPTGIAIDRDNRIYVADAFNGRVNVYQLVNTRAEDSFAPPPSRSEDK